MSNVTRILSRIESGDQHASAELLPLVYDQLRALAGSRMASERPDHTLSATALVHEAYVRLVDGGVDGDNVRTWDSRGHFFAAAAKAMRDILVDGARRKAAQKRGGELQRVDLEDLDLSLSREQSPDLILDVDDVLKKLAEEDPIAAELAQLRLFAGLSISEAGQTLGMSRSTAYENWRFVRSWFAAFPIA